MSFLCRAGVCLSSVDGNGSTPLQLASREGHVQVVNQLVAARHVLIDRSVNKKKNTRTHTSRLMFVFLFLFVPFTVGPGRRRCSPLSPHGGHSQQSEENYVGAGTQHLLPTGGGEGTLQVVQKAHTSECRTARRMPELRHTERYMAVLQMQPTFTITP